jgi:hypothetical protein
LNKIQSHSQNSFFIDLITSEDNHYFQKKQKKNPAIKKLLKSREKLFTLEKFVTKSEV